MTTKIEYPVATLAQMADIPEEALPRFLAELPAILATVRQLKEAAPQVGAEMKAKAPWPFCYLPVGIFERTVTVSGFNRCIWKDDDKGLATVTARMGEGKPAFYKRTEKMAKP